MNYCLSSLALGYELNFLPPSPTRDTNQRSQWRCRSTAPDLEKCSPVYLHHPLPSGYPPKHELHLTLKSTSEGGHKEPETIVNRKRSPPVETITLRLWKGLAGPSVTRPTEHRPLRALSDIASLGQLQREEKTALGGNLTWCAEVYTNNSRLAWSSGIASVLW